MKKTTTELLINKFECDLAFIEDPEDYYAMFRYVIASIARVELENTLLHHEGVISGDKYVENANRIDKARELAIKTHGEWTVKMLEQSKTQHTPRTLVSSIYADIFGIELKGDDELKERIRKEFEKPDVPFKEWFARQLQKDKDKGEGEKYYQLGNEEVFLSTDTYRTTANTVVSATCSNGEPYCCLTVNIDKLASPELAYLNVNLYGIDVEDFFVKNGLAVKVEGKEQQSGHVVYPLYRLNLKKIRGEM